MDFTLSDEHRAIRDAARQFARGRIAPRIRDYEQRGEFPRELASEMGAQGFFGCAFPSRYGGSESGFLGLTLVIEEISRVWQPIAGLFNMCAMTVPFTILNWGNEDQRLRYVPKLISAEWIGSFGLTEPSGGSDPVRAMRTRATKVDGGYVINGSKIFNTLAHIADVDLVFAKTDPDAGHHGISAFIVPLDSEGITKAAISHSFLGEALPSAEIAFDDVFVPEENLLGEEGQGFKIAMNALDYGRLTVAARCLGIAQGSLDAATDYARKREAFGRPIGEFQMVQSLIADMVAETEATRLLTYRCGWLKDCGTPATRESAVAKYFAAEAATHCAQGAFEIFGGYAVTDEYPAARLLSWAHLYRTGEGSANILRILLAEDALGWKPANRHGLPRPFPLESDVEAVLEAVV